MGNVNITLFNLYKDHFIRLEYECNGPDDLDESERPQLSDWNLTSFDALSLTFKMKFSNI